MMIQTVFTRRVLSKTHKWQATKRCLATSRLSDEERAAALSKLSENSGPFRWEQSPNRNAIQKTFTFKDFSQAWRFMSGVALLAEKENHHPEWFNVYNIVEVTLATHECNGVSEKDIKMAQAMDSYAADLLPNRS